MKKYAQRIAMTPEGKKWMAMYEKLEAVMLPRKSIYPNLDFAAALPITG
jgi:2-methylcitrate synthase